jgi:hypothetical protein
LEEVLREFGRRRVFEDSLTLGKRQVACEQDAAAFVTLGHQKFEQLNRCGRLNPVLVLEIFIAI